MGKTNRTTSVAKRNRDEERMVVVSRLSVEGHTVREIAAKAGLSKSEVGRLLDRCRAEWREARLTNTADIVAQQIAKLDLLEREAWRGWKRSLKDEVAKKIKHSKDANDAVEQTLEEATRGQAGDNSFLQTIARCVEVRNKLLGLNPQESPVTVNVDSSQAVDAEGNPIESQPVFVVVNTREESMTFDQFFASMKLKTAEELRADQKLIIDGKATEKQSTD